LYSAALYAASNSAASAVGTQHNFATAEGFISTNSERLDEPVCVCAAAAAATLAKSATESNQHTIGTSSLSVCMFHLQDYKQRF
jgi:hypothetical protein